MFNRLSIQTKLNDYVKNNLKNNWYYLFIFAFIFLWLLLPFKSNFSTNDDWIFVRQVETYITNNNIIISSLIDPSFISQLVVSIFWSNFFGSSFVSLRFLTLLFTIILFVTYIKTLNNFKISKTIILISIISLFFNPLIIYSSFTFMTEIYYLLFFSMSLLFYTNDIENIFSSNKITNYKNIVFAGFFTSLATLSRQYGIVLFLSYFLILFIIYVSYYFDKVKIKVSLKNIFLRCFVVIFFMSISLLIYSIWPRFTDVNEENNILSNLADFQKIKSNIYSIIYTLPYFVYFLSPFVFLFKNKIDNIIAKSFFIITIISLTVYFFSTDIFALGNIFYIEGLSLKSDYRHVFILTDTITFKIIFSLLLGYFTFSFINIFLNFSKKINISNIKNNFKLTSENSKILFLSLASIASFFVLMLATDFYDRYLLNTFYSLFIVFAYIANLTFSQLKKYKKYIIILYLIFFTLLNYFINYDYFITHAKLWELGNKTKILKEVSSLLYINDTHSKYFSSKDNNYITGNEKMSYFVNNSICYVQSYNTENKDNLFFKFEDFLSNYIDNPRIKGSKKKNISRIKNNTDKIIYNEYLFSPLYELIGSKLYVGSYCIKEL